MSYCLPLLYLLPLARLDPSTAIVRFDDAHSDWVSHLVYLLYLLWLYLLWLYLLWLYLLWLYLLWPYLLWLYLLWPYSLWLYLPRRRCSASRTPPFGRSRPLPSATLAQARWC